MLRRLLSHSERARHLLLALALALLALLPNLAFAQSACTAMWGTFANVQAIGYYNGSAGTASKWTQVAAMPGTVTNANGLGGDSTTGLLWFYDRGSLRLHSFDPNTYQFSAGVALSTASPSGNAAILGATFDGAGNYYLLSSSAGFVYHISQVTNKATGANSAWTTVTYTVGGGLPASGGSGDMVLDQAGQAWLTSNTTPRALYPLTLSTAKVGTSVTYAIGPSIAGIAVDPVTGFTFIAGNSANSITYQINTSVPNAVTLTDASTAPTIGDLGNCVVAPAPPSISKSFSPTFQALGGSTTTLRISLNNINTTPVWLQRTFTDTFPAGMTVAATPNLTTGACAPSATVTNVITATAGANTLTFASGGRIPAGGCTITVSVTAAANSSAYTNTLAVGTLTTTSGSNAVAASATYKVGTDFVAGKSQCVDVCGTTSTGVVTIGGGQTVQYVLTVTNSASGGTGSVTFTDTLPTLMTPVLSITANMVGGGTCSTTTSVVGGATQVRGTLTNAVAGGECSVIVTSLVSRTQTVSTSVTNTLTLSPVSSTSDTNGANNTATVPTIVKASANLSVAKTDNKISVVAGSTTSYTITVANIGPAAAPGTTLFDPAVTGLSCTSVSCTSTAANMCPASPTIANLQNSGVGLQITPTFAINTTATFVVNCGVTATGLP